jgi:peptidyl-dipeptidase Dcp
MAKTPDTVFNFLNNLLEPSKRAAAKDLKEVQEFRKQLEGLDEIKPWDFAYYSEKLKEQKYSFNEEELRPYFKLENVIEGVFEHSRKLFGLNFKLTTDTPTYHPEVKTFEVYDSNNEYVGLFYMDFFPRETKKGGAWMTNYREQGLWSNVVRRPHVSIVCNFTKPTPTKPSLLSYDEVRTLFHEFGHALHGLLSQCKYRSLGGTNVFWDFVELPSQIMENWTEEKEGLDLFARHYETNETIPDDLVAKIKKSSRFQSGWMSLRQLTFALLDMKWYTTDPSKIIDVEQFENETTAGLRLLAKEPGTNMSCSFGHIFGGGYAAGYYSYKWAEVLDADAFEYFQEKGLYNTEVATKFKDSILTRGGTAHPMDLYKEFRGREPDPSSLLRRSGLI